MSTSDPTRADPMDSSPPVSPAVPPRGPAPDPDPVPDPVPLDQTFDAGGLIALRSAVAAHAAELGLPTPRRDELILLAHELASNAVVHGGGRGRLRLWAVDGRLYCEVSDGGPGLPDSLLTGGEQPPLGATGGRGLWLVRVLADDLDLRSGPAGSTITAMVLHSTGTGGGTGGGTGRGTTSRK
jgi:anti-sigma regulatory factor (Ser/Thr protein kinase)